MTVSFPMALFPFSDAVTLAVVVAVTVVVLAVNVTEVAPAAMGTLPGTVTAALLLVSVTETPPVGAGPESVIVPVEEAPP